MQVRLLTFFEQALRSRSVGTADTRPSWDDYFLAVARVIATRADCTRRQVGAVIVRNNRIVATGYNGVPAGEPGCLTAGACPRGHSDVPPGSSYDTGPGACIGIHAEANALLYAARDKCEGAVLYCTDAPCDGCARLLAGADIERIVVANDSGTSTSVSTPSGTFDSSSEVVPAGERADASSGRYRHVVGYEAVGGGTQGGALVFRRRKRGTGSVPSQDQTPPAR